MSKKKILSPFSFFLHLEFFAAPKEKAKKGEVRGAKLHPSDSGHEAKQASLLRMINKLKYRPLKPNGSYVQVQILFSHYNPLLFLLHREAFESLNESQRGGGGGQSSVDDASVDSKKTGALHSYIVCPF